jgi:hypothetical protein
MSFFGLFKGNRNRFGGGDGGSFATAVIVNEDEGAAGVKAEYEYIASQCGKPQRDWAPLQQTLQHHDGKPYDVLTVRLSTGKERTFHFDISNFFGK